MSDIRECFGAVSPSNTPEDFESIREWVENEVALDILAETPEDRGIVRVEPEVAYFTPFRVRLY